MRAAEAVIQWRSALRPILINPHVIATAGAMLTCVAVVLNLGPFGKTPSFGDGLRLHDDQAASAAMEQPRPARSVSRNGVEAAPPSLGILSAAEMENAFESTRAQLQLASLSVGADATWGPRPMSAQDAAPPLLDQASPDHVTRDPVVGIWAPDAATCSARNFRDGTLPTIINADGASAGDTFCMFTDKKQTETGWRVTATCASPRQRWTSIVRLSVNENRLTWTSKRGMQTYARCAPDVLMAQAR